jgi:hypothetical protein
MRREADMTIETLAIVGSTLFAAASLSAVLAVC